MPLTAWIAGGVAVAATTVLIAALWFDSLFEAPAATYTRSLVQHFSVRSVLAVFAHPDDETLAAGVLADAGARSGVEVRTITLTRGESGCPEPRVCRVADVALVRESELRRYGFALGIDHQEVWEYPDGHLGDAPKPAVVDRLVGRIRSWKPDLILAFDPGGGYNGHPDHRAAGMLTMEAVRASFDAMYQPELGAVHRTGHVAFVIGPARAFSTIGGPKLRAIAAVQPAANLAVPVDKRLRLLGWRIHASQHLERAYPLPGWFLFGFWDKEHYRVLDPGEVWH